MNPTQETTIFFNIVTSGINPISGEIVKLTIIDGNEKILASFDNSNSIKDSVKQINTIFSKAKYVISYNADLNMSFVRNLFDENNANRFPKTEREKAIARRRPSYYEEEYDDEVEEQNDDKLIVDCCMKKFAILYGEYQKNGKPKNQKLEKALDYYGISFDSSLNASMKAALACKRVWETMFPNFYKDGC